jgi:8-oxo-dGTP pyrophosphatase MutT (NUDIX family)
MKKMLPMKEYYASLPTKRMGAGCLFFDAESRILLVKPNYKEGWEIPGGVVEDDESPRLSAQRETLEEIGLEREIGRLLVVDYSDRVGDKSESLMFIFDGGVLSEDEIKSIVLQAEELDEFIFVGVDELPAPMNSTLARRVRAAWQQRETPTDSYRENQE